MSTTTRTGPLTQIAAAESTLAASIHAAADLIDRIGDGELAAAQSRLAASVDAAKARLIGHRDRATDLIESLVSFCAEMAFEVREDLQANDFDAPVAPLPPATSSNPAPSDPATVCGSNGRLTHLLGVPVASTTETAHEESVVQQTTPQDQDVTVAAGPIEPPADVVVPDPEPADDFIPPLPEQDDSSVETGPTDQQPQPKTSRRSKTKKRR